MDLRENIRHRFKKTSDNHEPFVLPEADKGQKAIESKGYRVFLLLIVARLLSALYNQLWDCDEGIQVEQEYSFQSPSIIPFAR
jgi:hypothetical protein